MRLSTLLTICTCFLASCATITTRRNYRIGIRSNAAASHIVYKDSSYSLPTVICVRKGKEPLKLKFVHGDTIRDITVRPRPCPNFIFGNLIWMQAAPIAYAVDFTNTKRFYYGKNLVFNTADTNTRYPKRPGAWRKYWSRSHAPHRGDVLFTISIPVGNNFIFKPEGEPDKNVWGCLGINAGLDYAYRDNRSIGIIGGTTIDYPTPFPAPFDYFGEHETHSSTWIGIMSSHYTRRLTFSYGLSYAHNSWAVVSGKSYDSAQLQRAPLTKSWNTLAILAGLSFSVNRFLRLGVLYRPSLFNIDKGSMQYEHVLSFNATLPLRLYRKR